MKKIIAVACFGIAVVSNAQEITEGDKATGKTGAHIAIQTPLEETFHAFSACDSRFFVMLKKHANLWETYAPIKQLPDAAWIAVKNRLVDEDSTVRLHEKPHLGQLKLLSYFDEVSDMGRLGKYYFWGFIVDGKVHSTAKQLLPLIENGAALQQPEANSYARSEVRIGKKWLSSTARPGTAPGNNKLERVLILEPDEANAEHTRVSCTLQGAVSAETLAELRPDIPSSEYPKPAPSFDEVALPAGLTEPLDSPLLRPKFKSLRYSLAMKKEGSDRSSNTLIEYVEDHGLLKKTEVYSPSFKVERLLKSDLFQIKAKLTGVGDGSVLLAQKVEASIPADWTPGEKLTATVSAIHVPAQKDASKTELVTTCIIGQRYPAKEVYDTLSGDAIDLKCSRGVDNTTEVAFIEDLGLAITRKSNSSFGQAKYEVRNLEVVR